MKRLLTTLLVYLFINSYNLNSQTIYSVDKWMEYIEEMASETEDEAQIENLYSDLSYLSEHTFELNCTETPAFPVRPTNKQPVGLSCEIWKAGHSL